MISWFKHHAYTFMAPHLRNFAAFSCGSSTGWDRWEYVKKKQTFCYTSRLSGQIWSQHHEKIWGIFPTARWYWQNIRLIRSEDSTYWCHYLGILRRPNPPIIWNFPDVWRIPKKFQAQMIPVENPSVSWVHASAASASHVDHVSGASLCVIPKLGRILSQHVQQEASGEFIDVSWSNREICWNEVRGWGECRRIVMDDN